MEPDFEQMFVVVEDCFFVTEGGPVAIFDFSYRDGFEPGTGTAPGEANLEGNGPSSSC